MVPSLHGSGVFSFLLLIFHLYGFTASALANSGKPKPHIVFILVDDLGFNDVGYNGKLHGSAVKTPNINKIASKGVILNNYYVQQSCSPTRASLMTGRYAVSYDL